MDVMEAYTDIIKENIEYEYLLRDNPYKKDVIEEILNLIVETVSVKRKGELLDEFIRNNECRSGIRRDGEEEQIRRAEEDAELAGYYQQVQDALEGTSTGDIAEGFEDITAGEVGPGERCSVREALATKGRTKGTPGAEDRKREEQLLVPEQQAKRNRRRAR